MRGFHWNKRCLPFTWKMRKLWLENEMVHTIPFWNISEIIDYQLNQCVFLFFVNFPIIDTSTFCDFSILRLNKLQHWIFSPKISTRMDGVNDKQRPGNSAHNCKMVYWKLSCPWNLCQSLMIHWHRLSFDWHLKKCKKLDIC